MTAVPALRHRSSTTLEARLYHALGHGQTREFFERLLSGYGAQGEALAQHIADDNPTGLRRCAIEKVEKHPTYTGWGSASQAEGYTAAQVWALGVGVVHALDWARVWPDSLRRLRKQHGWVIPTAEGAAP